MERLPSEQKASPIRASTKIPIRTTQPPKNYPDILCGWLCRCLRGTWKIVVAISIVATLVAFAFFWPPKIEASLGDWDASDPFSASFVIRNEWVLGLSEVTAALTFDEFKVTPNISIVTNGGGGTLTDKPWLVSHYLNVGEPVTLHLRDVLETPVDTFSGADLTVILSFRPWIIPHQMTKPFRFVAEKQRDGKFHWAQQPVK
jgi:hypothetical protein